MQREIKFRVWDTYRNKMIKWDELQSDSNYLCLMVFDGNGYRTRAMQYTGLKDKNGLEIYEGDIVIPQTFTNAKYRVYWSQERLQWSIINTSNVSKESGRALINNSTLYKVIGNIYENQELS